MTLTEYNLLKGSDLIRELNDKNSVVFFALGQTQDGKVYAAQTKEVDNDKLVLVLEALVKEIKAHKPVIWQP